MRRIISVFIILSFVISSVGFAQLTYAQETLALPAPGAMVNLSPAYVPVLIKGLRVHPENPLLFDFILDTGNSGLKINSTAFKDESQKLIKYFLASMTIKEDDLWVNLSPYEKDRTIPNELGKTELGRDMLAQDYILKQLTASLIYPEKQLGKEFWSRVYARAQQEFGTSAIPVNTFNKVWIVADKAKILERSNVGYVVGAHLKVMLEEDYLSLSKHVSLRGGEADEAILHKTVNDTSKLGNQILREIIIPELDKEVNRGENFAPLRQMFYSMILSSWYKLALKDALLNQVYSNKAKTGGVLSNDPVAKEKIFQRYLRAYKKGVFDFIKEDMDAASKQLIPRKYFSGGLRLIADPAMLIAREKSLSLGDNAQSVGDTAMVTVGIAEQRAVLREDQLLYRLNETTYIVPYVVESVFSGFVNLEEIKDPEARYNQMKKAMEEIVLDSGEQDDRDILRILFPEGQTFQTMSLSMRNFIMALDSIKMIPREDVLSSSKDAIKVLSSHAWEQTVANLSENDRVILNFVAAVLQDSLSDVLTDSNSISSLRRLIFPQVMKPEQAIILNRFFASMRPGALKDTKNKPITVGEILEGKVEFAGEQKDFETIKKWLKTSNLKPSAQLLTPIIKFLFETIRPRAIKVLERLQNDLMSNYKDQLVDLESYQSEFAIEKVRMDLVVNAWVNSAITSMSTKRVGSGINVEWVSFYPDFPIQHIKEFFATLSAAQPGDRQKVKNAEENLILIPSAGTAGHKRMTLEDTERFATAHHIIIRIGSWGYSLTPGGIQISDSKNKIIGVMPTSEQDDFRQYIELEMQTVLFESTGSKVRGKSEKELKGLLARPVIMNVSFDRDRIMTQETLGYSINRKNGNLINKEGEIVQEKARRVFHEILANIAWQIAEGILNGSYAPIYQLSSLKEVLNKNPDGQLVDAAMKTKTDPPQESTLFDIVKAKTLSSILKVDPDPWELIALQQVTTFQRLIAVLKVLAKKYPKLRSELESLISLSQKEVPSAALQVLRRGYAIVNAATIDSTSLLEEIISAIDNGTLTRDRGLDKEKEEAWLKWGIMFLGKPIAYDYLVSHRSDFRGYSLIDVTTKTLNKSIDITTIEDFFQGNPPKDTIFYELTGRTALGATKVIMVAFRPDMAMATVGMTDQNPWVQGGIDLNARNLHLDVNGSGVQMQFDPAMVAEFRRGDFSGIVPIIIRITPVSISSILKLDQKLA